MAKTYTKTQVEGDRSYAIDFKGGQDFGEGQVLHLYPDPLDPFGI